MKLEVGMKRELSAAGPVKRESPGSSAPAWKAKLEAKLEAKREAKQELKQEVKQKFKRELLKREAKAEPKSEHGVKSEAKLKAESIDDIVRRGIELRSQAERMKQEQGLKPVKREKGGKAKAKRKRGKGRASAARRASSREVMGREVPLSPAMASILDAPALSRPEAVKRLWAHCREQGMLNPQDKREIIFTPALAELFGTPSARLFNLLSLLMPHLDFAGSRRPAEREDVAEEPPAEQQASKSEPCKGERSCKGERLCKGEAPPVKKQCIQTDHHVKQQRTWEALSINAGLKSELASSTAGMGISSSPKQHEVEQGLRPAKGELAPPPSPGVAGKRLEVDLEADCQVDLEADCQNGKSTASPQASVHVPVHSPIKRTLDLELEADESPLVTMPSQCKQEQQTCLNTLPLASSPAVKREPVQPVLEARISPEDCARRTTLRFVSIGRDSSTVECRPPSDAFRFDIVALPVGNAAQPQIPLLENCKVAFEESASGDLEPCGEVLLAGLECKLSYSIAVEIRPLGSGGGGKAAATSPAITLPQRADPAQWTTQEVLLWCRSLQVPELARKVQEYRIDGKTLLALGDEDLSALGLAAPFLRRRVLQGLEAVRRQ